MVLSLCEHHTLRQNGHLLYITARHLDIKHSCIVGTTCQHQEATLRSTRAILSSAVFLYKSNHIHVVVTKRGIRTNVEKRAGPGSIPPWGAESVEHAHHKLVGRNSLHDKALILNVADVGVNPELHLLQCEKLHLSTASSSERARRRRGRISYTINIILLVLILILYDYGSLR